MNYLLALFIFVAGFCSAIVFDDLVRNRYSGEFQYARAEDKDYYRIVLYKDADVLIAKRAINLRVLENDDIPLDNQDIL